MGRKRSIRGRCLNSLDDPFSPTPHVISAYFFHGPASCVSFYLKPNYTKYQSSHNYENLNQQRLWAFMDLILFPQIPNSLFYSNVWFLD